MSEHVVPKMSCIDLVHIPTSLTFEVIVRCQRLSRSSDCMYPQLLHRGHSFKKLIYRSQQSYIIQFVQLLNSLRYDVHFYCRHLYDPKMTTC